MKHKTIKQYMNIIGLTNSDIKELFEIADLTLTIWFKNGAPLYVLKILQGYIDSKKV